MASMTAEQNRWVTGDLTRFCGHGMHAECEGTVVMGPAQAPCLCPCHTPTERES